jgi:hypothetical protein
VGIVKDLQGQRFGRLVAIKAVGLDSSRNVVWEFACDCGKAVSRSGRSVCSGRTKSCGCLRSEVVAQLNTSRHRVHGESGRNMTPEYRAFCGMWTRCGNSRTKDFRLYGERGITVCRRWKSYSNFLNDMGRKPSPKHSLDRIDNSKGYRPSNCRWATAKEQARNSRKVKLTQADVAAIRASTGSSSSLAAKFGVSRGHVWGVRTGRAWKQ